MGEDESTFSLKACVLDNPPILYSRTVEDGQYRMANSFKSKARMYKNILDGKLLKYWPLNGFILTSGVKNPGLSVH
jgi:hypothetical protein